MAEEKKTTLEEAIQKFLEEENKHCGWEWQTENVENAFIAGAEWQKQQMLKDAVERTVKIDSGGYPYVTITTELYDYEHDVPLAKEGDLVKIIIVKSDESI